MDFEAYTNYTNTLLQNLDRRNKPYSLNTGMVEEIHRLNNDRPATPRIKQTEFNAVSGPAFKIPSGASSMPYIWDIKDDNKVSLRTIEPAVYKMSTGSRVSNELKATRFSAFRQEAHNINKAAFGRGLDLDNFTVLNVANAPMNKDNLKFLTNRGGIIPLGTNHGVFIPDFALHDATWMSAEYEGRFTESAGSTYGDSQKAFNKLVTTPAKNAFGIDVRNLLSHDAGSSYSYKAYTDHTINARSGRHTKEVVFGAAPLSNLVMGMHTAFAAWDKQGLVHSNDRVMDQSSGMHISTTLPALKTSSDMRTASQYLHTAGNIMAVLGRTRERWKSTSEYLGIPTSGYNNGRNDFRLDSSTQRLESRYPGTVMDIGYVSNQLIMASKISADTQMYMKHNRLNETSAGSPATQFNSQLSGAAKAETHLFTPLHAQRQTQNSIAANHFFDNFMETMGVSDDFTKQFVKNINKQCSKTTAPRG